MPLFLKTRDATATERMDDPNCDLKELNNTYRQFHVINSLISQWKKIYRTHIYPVLKQQSKRGSILDIGFGGGDIPVKLAAWAEHDGLSVDITGIETDERAYRFVQTIDYPETVTFQLASSTDLIREKRTFDFVISNHLLHHLSGSEFSVLLDEAIKLSTRKVLFNDIERSDIGYLLFNLLSRPVFRSSFITHDGLASIRRSYTAEELRNKAPDEWKVQRIFPFRLLLSYAHDRD